MIMLSTCCWPKTDTFELASLLLFFVLVYFFGFNLYLSTIFSFDIVSYCMVFLHNLRYVHFLALTKWHGNVFFRWCLSVCMYAV